MMPWFDHFSLAAIIVIPVIGSVFLRFIPKDDTMLRKRVALFAVLAAAVFHIRNSYLFFNHKGISLDISMLKPVFISGQFLLRLDLLSFISLSHLLIIVVLLLYCDLTRNSQPFSQLNLRILLVLALASAGILIDNYAFFLLIQFAIVQMLLIFNLGEGGHHRGSSALAASLCFTVIDLTAVFIWTFDSEFRALISPEILLLINALPWLTRILVPFVSPWARRLFANTSIEITILYLATSFMTGVAALARASLNNSFLSYFALAAAAFGALLSLSDRHRAQFLMRVISIGGTLCFAILASAPSEFLASRTLFFVSSLAIIISLALLVQRSMSEESSEKGEYSFSLLWFSLLAMINTIPLFLAGTKPWNFESTSSYGWVCVYSLVTVGIARQVTIAPSLTPRLVDANTKALPSLVIVNAWLCFAFALASTGVFLFILPSLVQPK